MKKYTKIICLIAAVCLLGTAAFCGFRIYSHYAHESEQEEVFEKIAEVVEQAQTGESETTDVLLTEEETVLAEYGELYLQNTDMVGWLSIAGTNINYPVMQTPNNPNYYLKHNFEKEYSDLGTPYVQENCDLLTSDNLVIYGHHIKGQKMFGALENYKSKDFYEEHKTFRFDTLTKRGEYEIIAVFKTVAYSSAGFRYYDFVNAEDENDFNAYIAKCKELALYDTGVTAEYHLLDKGRATASELAEKFEVSVRTIYRDIDALSGAGIPIYNWGQSWIIWVVAGVIFPAVIAITNAFEKKSK